MSPHYQIFYPFILSYDETEFLPPQLTGSEVMQVCTDIYFDVSCSLRIEAHHSAINASYDSNVHFPIISSGFGLQSQKSVCNWRF